MTFPKLLDELKELHERKAADYSDGTPFYNFEFSASIIKEFTNPIDVVFVALISTKLARLAQLLQPDRASHNESIQDSLRDLTVYCGMWATYYESNSNEVINAPYDTESPPQPRTT
jgi:hypothetical protein